MTSVRLLLIASLSALCLCACASFAPALGASVTRGKPAQRRAHGRRAVHCAKTSSFHTGVDHKRRKHHTRRHASCLKRHSSRRHLGAGHHRRFRGHRHAGHRHRAHARPRARSGVCPNATLAPTEQDVGRLRAATLCLINHERVTRGEPPLRPNVRLARAAQGHSREMASHDYFEHLGRPGDTPLHRIRAAGYIFSSRVGYELGENIAYGTLWRATPSAIVAAWMTSPEHRANILDRRFRDTAIGIYPRAPVSFAHGQAGAVYTQEFGVIVR